MPPKFAVVGAGSFSGTVFVAQARGLGHEVVKLSRPDFDLNKASAWMADRIGGEGVTHVVNFSALNMVAESWANAADYYRTNVIGVAALCDQLRIRGWNGRFVQVSTPEVYGAQGGPIREGAPFRPSTPYAVSRAAIDMHLRALHAAFGFRVLFTRSVNVYGPGQPIYRLIPKTVLSILRGVKLTLHGGGVSGRAWLHVSDVAEAIRRTALTGDEGKDYHFAAMPYLSVCQLVETVCREMGTPFDDAVQIGPERPGKDMDYQLDDSRARSELGWSNRIGLRDGVAETVAWFIEHAGQFAGQSLEYVHRG
ncbi:MAG: GDP-mannose 4,6-dehydratase [Burkholderiales bacterium]